MANTSTGDKYSLRSRRLLLEQPKNPVLPRRLESALAQAAPAVAPPIPPGPFGDLSRATVDEIADLEAERLQRLTRDNRKRHRNGLRTLLGHLEQLPGETWQERWEASRFAAERPVPVNTIARSHIVSDAAVLTTAAKVAFSMRVIRPTVASFRANKFIFYADTFQEFQQDPLLDQYNDTVDRHPHFGLDARNRAKFDVACALTTQGIALRDLTPAALLHHSLGSRNAGASRNEPDSQRFIGHGAWRVLVETGIFPDGTAATLHAFLSSKQASAEELIDRYNIRNPGIRQLLIDYVSRRRAETDYTTNEHLALVLAGTFWSAIQDLNPDQPDLALSPELYDQWIADLRFWRHDKTKLRKGVVSVLFQVRAFYLDIQSWALDEPERWGRWVVPCPIRPSDIRGEGKRKREVYQRMADRTRVRQPLLPALLKHVEDKHAHLAGLLRTGQEVELGQRFEYQGRTYHRTNSTEDQRRLKREAERLPVRVIREDTQKTTNVTLVEDTAFWEWAVVAILRHSGIRIEELCELTHLSVRQYQRPSGEAIALLVIAPSKTDRERVIPMSAELFHAVAQVIIRQTRDGHPIAPISRYDTQEKVWTEPMPYLFQRQMGPQRRVLATGSAAVMLRRLCGQLGETDPAFRNLVFTPHDFRRLFATEIVNAGLPIHIGAALLGHLDLRTTQGYVAVFAEDVVHHYQQFINHRRTLRPAHEYAPITEEEWAEFEEHFDKRKVELGTCGRPYGTDCPHEHACIRCPMLQVNPKMAARLDELEKDLLLRRKRAVDEGWLGEIEGIDHTLTCLRSKQLDIVQAKQRRTVNLGIPGPQPPKETSHP